MLNTLFHFDTDPATVVLVRKCPILTPGIYVYVPIRPENKFPNPPSESIDNAGIINDFPTESIHKSEDGDLCTILSSAVDLTDIDGRVFQSVLLKKYVEVESSADPRINSRFDKTNKNN